MRSTYSGQKSHVQKREFKMVQEALLQNHLSGLGRVGPLKLQPIQISQNIRLHVWRYFTRLKLVSQNASPHCKEENEHALKLFWPEITMYKKGNSKWFKRHCFRTTYPTLIPVPQRCSLGGFQKQTGGSTCKGEY